MDPMAAPPCSRRRALYLNFNSFQKRREYADFGNPGLKPYVSRAVLPASANSLVDSPASRIPLRTLNQDDFLKLVVRK